MLRLALLVPVFVANTSWAADAATRTPELATGSVAMQVLTGLGFVTCAIFGLAWVAKRLGGAKLMQQNGMNIVASMAVGTREKIVLLKVNNTNILVGVTAQNISSLHVFDADSESEHGAVNSVAISAENREFSQDSSAPGAKGKWDFAHYIKQFTTPGSNLRDLASHAREEASRTSETNLAEKNKAPGQ